MFSIQPILKCNLKIHFGNQKSKKKGLFGDWGRWGCGNICRSSPPTPHWSPALIWMIWLARQISLVSPTTQCVSLLKAAYLVKGHSLSRQKDSRDTLVAVFLRWTSSKLPETMGFSFQCPRHLTPSMWIMFRSFMALFVQVSTEYSFRNNFIFIWLYSISAHVCSLVLHACVNVGLEPSAREASALRQWVIPPAPESGFSMSLPVSQAKGLVKLVLSFWVVSK